MSVLERLEDARCRCIRLFGKEPDIIVVSYKDFSEFQCLGRTPVLIKEECRFRGIPLVPHPYAMDPAGFIDPRGEN